MSGGRVNACVYPPNPIIPMAGAEAQTARPTDDSTSYYACRTMERAREKETRLGGASLVGRQSMDSLIRQMIALRGGRTSERAGEIGNRLIWYTMNWPNRSPLAKVRTCQSK